MLNIAVLVSGGGTNLQALLDSEARGENPNGRITLVVASKPGVYALERAAKAGVEGCVVRRKDYASSEDFDAALLKTLKDHNIDLVVLAGGTSILSETSEFIGAEHILARRAINKEVHDRIYEITSRFAAHFHAVGEDVRQGNPSPGNTAGGITTLEEKSLGCIH